MLCNRYRLNLEEMQDEDGERQLAKRRKMTEVGEVTWEIYIIKQLCVLQLYHYFQNKKKLVVVVLCFQPNCLKTH